VALYFRLQVARLAFPELQVQVPNPYKNPKPHLLTDAWAMRA
jgi:hypothetical protein